ncbi:MAG TPA: response regulator [Anaerovoracaceae bacterium]|nr:response regulator [Anaerovoracaceae bacterium]
MENLPVVVLLDQNTMVKSRIRNIFANQGIEIHEASNRRELMRILAQNNNKVDLIVSEIEIDVKNGFSGIDLIQLVKAKRSSIPVVLLSSVGRKEVITKCLLEGAADYILKPFKDEYLKEKLLKYINIENLTESTVLQFNLKDFLDSEIYKAKKGNYCFSLLKIQFDSSADDESILPKYGFCRYAEFVYQEMRALFWDSDLYIRHGYQCHLGFFPFCNQRNTEVIIDKIKSGFESSKLIEPNLSDYFITHAFATFPMDGETTSELLSNLSVVIQEQMQTA